MHSQTTGHDRCFVAGWRTRSPSIAGRKTDHGNDRVWKACMTTPALLSALTILRGLNDSFACDMIGMGDSEKLLKSGPGRYTNHRWRLLHSNALWEFERDFDSLARRGSTQEPSEPASSRPQMMGGHCGSLIPCSTPRLLKFR
jgi:hypothetical protein